MKRILVLIFTMLLMACVVNAQPKPKRDVSKDKKTAVAERKTHTRKNIYVSSVRGKCRGFSRKRNNGFSNRNKTNYLYVNGEAQYCSVDALPCAGGTLYFRVRTDGKNWAIDHIPSWCEVESQDSDGFYLEFSGTNYERSNWLSVQSGDKCVVINLSQLGE